MLSNSNVGKEKAVDSKENQAESSIPSGPPYPRFSGQRVLVADDSAPIREVLVEILTLSGLHVTEACNGAEAVEILSKEDFDLVLMDLQMPILDGLSAVRRIRELDRHGARSLPIIAITGEESKNAMEQSRAAGMNAHISKPFTPKSIFNAILPYLSMKEETGAEKGTGRVIHGQEREEPLPPEDYPLNVAKGVHQVGGNRDLYEELLRRFVLEYREKGEEIRQETEKGNFSKAEYIAYTVNEIACLLAAYPLQSAAGELESELRCCGNRLEPLLTRFQVELSRVVDFYLQNIRNREES